MPEFEEGATVSGPANHQQTSRSSMVLHYKDDGPSGPCGQVLSTTAPWDRLYRYESDEDAVAFMRWLRDNAHRYGRRNPRIVAWWYGEHVEDGPMVPESDRA